MLSPLDASRDQLTGSALKVLKENAVHNRSGLPPFRLPQVAQKIVAGLIAYTVDKDETAGRALGQVLAHQGLGMRSLVAVGRVIMKEILARPPEPEGGELAYSAHVYLTLLTEALAAGEIGEFSRQRDEMQIALERSIHNRELELRKLIQDLSTPIMPVHNRVLVLPLVGEIDDERAQKINEKLLQAVSQRQARTVIIDITGVPSVDMAVASALMGAARAVQLLGARVVLVGIRPEVARTLTQLDIAIEGVRTLANLQRGIEYALELQGLAVREALPRGRARFSHNRKRSNEN
jgi:rsbT co-antagonist protein RsbR